MKVVKLSWLGLSIPCSVRGCNPIPYPHSIAAYQIAQRHISPVIIVTALTLQGIQCIPQHTLTDVERDSAGCDKIAVHSPVSMTNEPGHPLQTI